MKNWRTLYIYCLTVITVFGFTIVWEFVLEPIFNLDGEPKLTEEKWEFIYTILSISALAAIFPFIWLQRRIARERQTEALYRQSEKRFLHSFEFSPVGMALITVEGERFKVNRALADFLGYTLEELENTPISSTAADADLLKKSERLRQRVIDGELTTYTNERSYRHKQGHIVWGEVTGTLVRDEKGKPLYFVVHTLDITDRKRTEEARRKSEERLRGAIESLQEGFVLFDADDRLVMANDVFRRINPEADSYLEQGLKFEDLIRANVERGWMVEAIGREEEFIRERLEQHRNPGTPIIRQFSDGKWYILKETRTPEGGIALTFFNITDIRKAEEDNRRLAEAIEGLSDIFALYGPDDRLLICNENFRRNNEQIAEASKPGVLFEDHVRAMVENGLAPQSLRREEQWVQERLARHRNPEGPFEVERQDGRWFLVHEQRMLDGSTATIATDITERKRMDDALVESEERYRNLVEFSADFIYAHCGGKLVYVNPAGAEFLGADSPDRLIGRPLKDIIHPEDWASTQARVKQVIGMGVRTPLTERRYVGVDGRIVYAEAGGTPFLYKGKSASFVVARDLTERKKAEEDNRRLAEAIEGLSENFALYGPDDRLVMCNQGYSKLNEAISEATRPGVSYEEHMWAVVAKGLAPKAVGREEDYIRERMELHRNSTGPYEVVRQDGVWLVHEQRATDGSTAIIATDITQFKRTEEAVRESEERHKRFTADVAHELRTPLAVLRSHLDNLENTERIQSLIKDVDAMSRLVSQLLATTRLDSLTVNPNDEADLHAIGTEVAKYLGPFAIKEGRSIEVTGTQSPVIVRGNDDALEMAARNLVENAIRYSARETVVTIHVSDEPAISVIDHGRGIPREQQKVIFQRFRRADRRSGGAGLGLSIVQRVVEAHRATIDVTDAPGGGAVFKISFPSHESLKVVAS